MVHLLLAGGCGLRVSHLTKTPKQFFYFQENLSCFILALMRIPHGEKIFVITTQEYIEIAKTQTDQANKTKETCFIIEPKTHNTLTCVFLSAMYLQQTECNDKLTIAPTDHLIFNFANYKNAIKKALNFKENLILFGVKPTYAEDNYGHVVLDSAPKNFPVIMRAKSFIEKPNTEIIKKLKYYLWNSGIFCVKMNYLLRLIKKFLITKYGVKFDQLNYVQHDNFIFLDIKNYNNLPNIPLDYAFSDTFPAILYAIFDWLDIGNPRNFDILLNAGSIAQLVRAHA